MALKDAQKKIDEIEQKKAPVYVKDPGASVQRASSSSGSRQTGTTSSKKSEQSNVRVGAKPTTSTGMGLTSLFSKPKADSIKGNTTTTATGATGATSQNMSAYRGNLFTPSEPTKPTYRGAMADVYRLNKVNPTAASQIFTELQNSRFDPTSPYYDPFARTTNRAAERMQELGYDVSNIDDAWFEQHSYLRQYYVPTANTNGLSTTMTNKRSTPEQQAAYYYNQLYMAREATKKTQQETDALEQELKYWASRKDLNLSDDEIIGKIDWGKYPTLSKIDSYRSGELDPGTPMELNAPVRYSKDWMYGTLWAARNNGGTNNDISNMINSVLGVGNIWHNDQEIHDKLEPGNPEYSPYSVGSTMDNECCYFGVPSFSRDWIDRNYRRIMNSGDKTAIKMFGNVVDAVEYTETLDAELAAMNAEIDKMLKYISDPDTVIKRIKENSEFKDLFALDDTLTHPSQELKKTAWAVDYRWVDVEARVRKACAENEEKRNAADIVEDAQNIDVPYFDGEVLSYNEMQKKLEEEERMIEGGNVSQKEASSETSNPLEPIEIATVPEKQSAETNNPEAVTPTAAPAKETPAPTNTPAPAAAVETSAAPSKSAAISANEIGQFGAGNIDLFNREAVIDKDGNVETVRSISFYDDQSNKEVLIPTIIDGKEVSDNEAIDHYYETGEFLGKFDSVDEANAYAEQLHLQQEQLYTDSVNSVAKEDLIAPEKPAAEETATPAPVVSDSEKEIMQQEKANLDEVAPVVMEYGTPAEKVAVQTVHSMDYHYNQHMKTFRDMYPDAGDKWLMSAATKNLVGDYFSNYDVIWNYNRAEAEKEEAEAELAGTEARWKELSDRNAPIEALGLNNEQIVMLTQLATDDSDNTWTALKDILNNGGDAQDVALAQTELYSRVTGDFSVWQYDDATQAECRQTAQQWWDDYHANDFSGVEPLSYEEEMELAAIQERRDALQAKIDKSDAFMADKKDGYTQAISDKEQLEKSYAMGAMLYGQDMGLLEAMDEFYSIGMDASPFYPIGDVLEYYVSNGEMSEEDAAFYERRSSVERAKQADRLSNLLNTMDRMGIPVPDEMRQNVQTRIGLLNADAEASGYALLDNKGDFDRVVEETQSKAKSFEYVKDTGLFDSFGTISAAIANDDFKYISAGTADVTQDLIDAMTPLEKKRFMYVLGTEGVDAAKKYWDLLTNEDSGVLLRRRSNSISESALEFASSGPIQAAIASVFSLGTKFVGGYRASAYEVMTYLQGKSINPSNPNFDWQRFTGSARYGSSEALANMVGGGTFGKIASFLYNGGMGIADFMLKRKFISGAFGALGIGKGASNVRTIASNTTASDLSAKVVESASAAAKIRGLDIPVEATISAATGVDAVKVASKAFNIAVAASIAQDSASSAWWSAVYNNNATPDEALAYSGITFVGETLAYSFIVGNMNKVLTGGREGGTALASFVRDLYVGGTEHALSAGTVTAIEQEANKWILKEKSNYESRKAHILERYKGKYPEAIANQMAEDQANQEAWHNIVVNAGQGALMSTLFTAGVYAYKYAPRISFDFRRGGKASATGDGNGASERTSGREVPKIGANTQEWDVPSDEQIEFVVNRGDAETGSEPMGLITAGESAPSGEVAPGTGGSPIVPDMGNDSGVSNLPSQASIDEAQAITSRNANQFARDQAMLASGMTNTSPAGEAFTIDGVLGNSNLAPDPNATRAAAQNLVGGEEFANGRTKTATKIMSIIELVVPEQNLDMIKWDITQAAIVSGSEGASALSSIFYKVGQGEMITPDDVYAVSKGVANDKANDPEYDKKFADGIRDNRIALEMANIFMSGSMSGAIHSAEESVKQASENARRAEKVLENAEADLKSAEKALNDATNNHLENPLDPSLNAPVEQATNKIEAADRNLILQQDAVKDAQENLESAKVEKRRTEEKELNKAREEATSVVDQKIADEQAALAEANAAAEQENAEAQTLSAEQAEKAAATRATQENYVRSILAESNITGEQAETIVQRAMSRADEVARGGVDMNAPINAAEGQQFLDYLSNTMGFQIEMKDLGNPRVVRGMNIGGDRLVLNSQLSKGQALVEATFHEMIHGLESTPAYKPFSDVVTDILFKGEDTPAFREAIRKKKLYYSAVGAPLATDDDAKREIVADFGRTHLASKKFLRKIVNAGAGNEVKKYVRKAWTNLKGYKLDAEGTAERRKLQKAERLLQQMLAELAQMRKEGYKGHTGITQFSINSAAQMAGLKVEVTDDDNYLYKLYDNGKLIEPGKFTPEMVKNTPAGRLIDMGIKRREKMLFQRLSYGFIRKAEYETKLKGLQEKANEERKFISDIINMIGKYQDAAMVWELSGSLAFSVLKTNGDPQYFDSEDMGSICTKTQAILNVMSETQLRLGRALTKDEIDKIVYEEVGKGVIGKDGQWQHGATPCPPCYVFATWVNKPARLEMIRKFQEETADWTDDDINALMNTPAPEPIPGKISKGKADKLKSALNAKKLWVKLCLADEHKDDEGNKTYTRKENPDICPNEILLDLRRSGDMATKHPGVWTFMQKGGNAVGKAISEYADSRLGETIVGKAIGASKLNEMLMADVRNASNPDYVPQFINPFLIMDDANAEKKAQEYFDRAVEKVKAQNLKNGQRWQSWSDFRAEWGSDYLMEMLVMDALGAKVQTYTKVHEALDLLASSGFEVNMSLMPHGDGFWHNKDGSIAVDEDGNLKLRFSSVTGINPEEAEKIAREYGEKGNVQPMVVGISDQHILTALAGDYIMFVIPFHGSGGSVKRLQNLMDLLKETMQAGFDYTKAQSDKFENFVKVDRQEGDDAPADDDEDENSGKKNTNPNWDLREAIITGRYDGLTDTQKGAIDNNKFLRKLYEDRYLNRDSEAFGVFFSTGQAQQIYPYEYWDTNTTLATADENSKRFCEYCQMLGVIPRFSGLIRKAGKNKYFKESEYGIADKLHPESIERDAKGRVIQYEYANFSGRRVAKDGTVTYNPVPGYWKLLIDRNMYKRVYGDDGKLIKEKCTYHEQQPVDVTNIKVGAMPMAANNTVGHNDDQVREITERVIQRLEMTSGQNKAAGSAVDMNENKKIIQDAMYGDSGVKLSAGGKLTDADLDQLLAEADRKYMAAVEAGDMETVQAMVDAKANEYINRLLLPDDSNEAGFKYHRGPAPTKTFKRYAVLNVSPDGFRAAYAGNKNPTPMGVWLDAQNLESYMSDTIQFKDGSFASYIKGDTGESAKKRFSPELLKEYGLKPSQNMLLERGGKHSSDVPNFGQMNLGQDENGNKVKNKKSNGALPHNKLIFEIEYGISDDGDLTDYVKEHGRRSTRGNEGLAKIQPNQYYDFKTNPNAVGQWGIGGTFRITRLVPYEEVVSKTEEYKANAIAEAQEKYKAKEISKTDMNQQIKNAEAIPIQKWVGGYHPEDFGLSVENVDEMVKRGKQMKLTDAVTYDDQGNVIPLSERFNPESQDLRHSIGGDLTDAEIDQLLVDSGIITPEMVPYSYLPGNRTGSGHGPYRQFGRYRAPESNALHDKVKDYLFNNSEYDPVRNRDQVDNAIAWVQGFANDNDPTGYYGALREVESPNFEFRTADAQVKMLTVMSMAALRAEEGDPGALADEKRVSQSYNKQGTPLAQALQARKLFRIMTPLGRMSVLEGMVENINEELRRKRKRANTESGRVELDDDLLQQAANARRPKDFDRVRKQARKKIAEQIPPDWRDKLRAFRYMSMLLNPRTHVRNVLGNWLFMPAVGVKNKIGALLELSQKQGNRTKTLRLTLPKEIRDFANHDAEESKDILKGTAKYDDRTEIDRERRIFKSFVHYIYKFSGDSLEWEDWRFLKGHYRRALGGWMVANGYTPEQLQSDPALLEKGRRYAVEEAQKATYRDFNELADRIAKFARDPQSDGAKAVAFLTNAVLPFKKTPANILSRAMEYSLYGLARSLTTDLAAMKRYLQWQEAYSNAGGGNGGNGNLPPSSTGGANGNPPDGGVPPTPPKDSMSPNEWIDRFASGLTGTGIMVAGAILASLGYITVKLEKEEKDIEGAKGNQEYSLKLSFFGHDMTYTLDWAAPLCMPFFVGALIHDTMVDKEGWDWREVLNAMASIADPLTNMSMLEGIGDVLRTSSNSGVNTISGIFGNVIANYATSFVPSVAGAIARTMDPYRRMVFLPSGHSDFAGAFEYAYERIENKLPGVSQQNIPYRDIWGNVEEKGDWERLIENFISPGYWKEYRDDDPVSDELYRLYSLVPDESYLIPKFPAKTISNIALTDKQWDDYRTIRNGTAYNELDRLFNSSYYQFLEPNEQAAQVKKVWEYCTGIGKLAVFPNMTVDKWITDTEDPIGTMIHTGDMLQALETRSMESYQDLVYVLVNEDGLEEKQIKEKIGDRYRNPYKKAYQEYITSQSEDAFRAMLQIEETLSLSGFEFDIHGKGGWEGQVDKKLAEEQKN